MSRFVTRTDNGEWIEEIESMDVCKWRLNEVCCNEDSEYLGWYGCHCEDNSECKYFEKEDGVIE